ncbi:hypothetical protein [Desulfosporosinus fructosivorans]
MSYKTYDSGCRGYVCENDAIRALKHLVKTNKAVDMGLEFHIEQLDRRELILEHRAFKGKNIVCSEKKVGAVA